jgi:hypothetical protein
MILRVKSGENPEGRESKMPSAKSNLPRGISLATDKLCIRKRGYRSIFHGGHLMAVAAIVRNPPWKMTTSSGV